MTDFGLARVPGESNLTLTGDVLGTLRYMSPEQALGKRVMLDGRSDVYSLGATLYELLTLRPAFGGDDRQEVLRRIAQEEPRPPRRLNPTVPAAFETIVLKAMAKEPARRYASAEALRDDLQRFLDNRPILGRPVSAWGRALSSARRRPAVAALLGVIIFMACGLVGGIAAWISWLAWHNQQLEVQVARADRQAREAARQTSIAENHRRLADRHHYAESLRLARRALDERQIELAQDILHDIQPGPDDSDPRGFAWRYLWRQAHRDFSQLWGHEAAVSDWAFSPNGKMLATQDLHGRGLIWDLAPDMALDKPRAIAALHDAASQPIWFSPDSRLIARLDQKPSSAALDVFDSASARHVTRLDCGKILWCGGLCFDTKSRRMALLAARPDGKRLVQSWDIPAGPREPHTWLIEEGTTFFDTQLKGGFLVVARGGRTHLLDVWTGTVQVELLGPELRSGMDQRIYACSADGRVFAAPTATTFISLWDTATGRELAACDLPANAAHIALSPKGSRLAMLDAYGRLTVFDRSTSRSRVLKSGSERIVKYHCLSFSSDEDLLAVGWETHPGGPQQPEVWDIAMAKRLAVFPGRGFGENVFFLPSRRSLIVVGGTTPRIWRIDPPSAPDALAGHASEAWAAAFAPTATCWPPAATIPTSARRSSSGSRLPGVFSPAGRPTRPPWRRSHSAPTGACSHRGAWIPVSREIPT